MLGWHIVHRAGREDRASSLPNPWPCRAGPSKTGSPPSFWRAGVPGLPGGTSPSLWSTIHLIAAGAHLHSALPVAMGSTAPWCTYGVRAPRGVPQAAVTWPIHISHSPSSVQPPSKHSLLNAALLQGEDTSRPVTSSVPKAIPLVTREAFPAPSLLGWGRPASVGHPTTTAFSRDTPTL